jgi:transposase
VSCRFVYNFYIAHNKDVYEKQKRFISGMDFSKWLNNDGVGIDLGIKNLAVVSNTEKPFKNINKTKKVKELEKKLKREQRKLSRKYESLKVRNKRKGGNATRQNIQKQIVKVQKLHNTLTNIRDNYINQVVNEIVKTKPSYISIEDLNVSGMMKNKHLARVIAQQKFYQLYRWLVGNLSLWSVKPNVSRVAIPENRHDEQGIFSIWVYLSIF